MADTRELIMDLDTPVWDPNRFKPVERRTVTETRRLFGRRKCDRALRRDTLYAAVLLLAFAFFIRMMFHN